MAIIAESPGIRSALSTPDPRAEAAAFLLALEERLQAQVQAFEPVLHPIVQYAIEHSGKRLRPILVYFSGADEQGDFADELVTAAAVVELVHLATLVHDDVLDEAGLRHGQITLRSKYGINASVLVGDAIFARALELAAEFPDTMVCRKVARATRRVCAGEVEQTLTRQSLDLDLARYFRIIEGKTAELFDVSCQLGALLSGKSPHTASKLGQFGRRLGVAYQIYDDMVDVAGEEGKAGKTLGTDLASGKSTLPLLLLRNALPAQERAQLEACFGRDQQSHTVPLAAWIQEFGVDSALETYFEEELDRAATCLSESGDDEVCKRLQGVVSFIRQRFQSVFGSRR